MNLRTRFADVCRVAVELEPEVLNLRVPKRLEDTSIELMSGRIRSTVIIISI